MLQSRVMKLLKLSQQALEEIAKTVVDTLKKGGLIVYPTDTVYGLAADATNQAAVDKLRAFKGQRGNKPISIAVANQAMAEAYVELNDTAEHLYHTFLPGPLTIVSKAKAQRSNLDDSAGKLSKPALSSRAAERNVMSTATRDPEEKRLAMGIASSEDTVGIRIIPHPFVQALFDHIDFPITATSANVSGGANPRSLKQWRDNTSEKKQALIDLFIDAGELPHAEPSTVIDTSKEATEIVRPGAIDLSSSILHQSSNAQAFTSHSPEETKQIAAKLVSRIKVQRTKNKEPILFALQGELGAGKTVFTQGLAQALGITEPLRSPTYTLVKEYKIHSSVIPHPSSRLFHIDAWRLSSPEEFQDLGLDNMLKPGNIIILEWPQRLRRLLKSLSLKSKLFVITITVIDDLTRKITYHHTT